MKECPVCLGDGLLPLLPEQEAEIAADMNWYERTGIEPKTMNRCRPCDGKGSVPNDYEPCGDCGFDHGYEQDEAVQAHARL